MLDGPILTLEGRLGVDSTAPKPSAMELTIMRYLVSSMLENEYRSTKNVIINAIRSAKVVIHAGTLTLVFLAMGAYLNSNNQALASAAASGFTLPPCSWR